MKLCTPESHFVYSYEVHTLISNLLRDTMQRLTCCSLYSANSGTNAASEALIPLSSKNYKSPRQYQFPLSFTPARTFSNASWTAGSN